MLNNYHYNYDDLLAAYRASNVRRGATVYVTGNFGRCGNYEIRDKNALLEAHLTAITELLGPEGTLVVPTHSFSLCNTDTPFDIANTASETGPFTELVRKQPASVRQFHPFSSSTALGAKAELICGATSRHVYGLNSPFQRMLDNDAVFISVGMPAARSVSLVHHIEFMMGVPYRYTKEFLHPCIVEQQLQQQYFYLHVAYRELDIQRDRNAKIFECFQQQYALVQTPLGAGFMQSFSMNQFVKSTAELMSRDIYAWLESPPTTTNRSYQK